VQGLCYFEPANGAVLNDKFIFPAGENPVLSINTARANIKRIVPSLFTTQSLQDYSNSTLTSIFCLGEQVVFPIGTSRAS
jgi:hypothetical protein